MKCKICNKILSKNDIDIRKRWHAPKGYCKECMYRQLRDNNLQYNRTINHCDGSLYISGGLEYHPHNTTGGIPEHRLIMEAKENGLTLNEWLDESRINNIGNYKFLSPELEIHHINGNASDNRIENLREITLSQNLMNAGKRKNTSSIFKGVSLDKRQIKKQSKKTWRAYININGKQKYLGY